jgi:hypothetical protein
MINKTKIFILVFFFSSVSGIAQISTMPTRFVELGFSTNSYKGDLSHSYSQWSNGVHLGILFNKKKRLNGHLNLMIGNAVAQNPNYFFDDGSNPQPTPNHYSRIKMYAVNYDVHVNLYKKHNLIVYLYQGIGLLRYDTRDMENKKLSSQLNTRAQNETYGNVTAIFPNGIGALYVSKIGFGAGFQAGFLNSTSDYLDNISKWGDKKHKDNVLIYKLTFYIPFSAKKVVN